LLFNVIAGSLPGRGGRKSPSFVLRGDFTVILQGS